jgi:membrane-associated phospholipid phosphatase
MDFIAKFFLEFTSGIVVAPILIFGFLFKSKIKYCQAGAITAFCIILNILLKGLFAIKASPDAEFAFPSGHMQAAVVFYWFLLGQNSKLFYKAIATVIIIGVGMGLIHFKYHTLIDVLGGLGFGFCLLAIYSLLLRYCPNVSAWLLVVAGFLTIQGIKLLYPFVPEYGWHAFYLLLSMVLLQELMKNSFLETGKIES